MASQATSTVGESQPATQSTPPEATQTQPSETSQDSIVVNIADPRVVLPLPPKKWKLIRTAAMDAAFVISLVAEHHKGKRVDPGGWKKESWRLVLTAVQFVFEFPYRLTMEQMKNHLVWWRAHYKLFKFLLNLSGLGFDPLTCTFDCDALVWDTLIAEKPKLREWRYQKVEYVDEMDIMFAGRMAIGSHARRVGKKRARLEEGSDDGEEEEQTIDPELRDLPPAQKTTKTPSNPTNTPSEDSDDQSDNEGPSMASRRKRPRREEDIEGIRIADAPVGISTRVSAADKFSLMLHSINEEAKLFNELYAKELTSQASAAEYKPNVALRVIAEIFPLVWEKVNLYRQKVILVMLAEQEEPLPMSRAEFFLSLSPRHRVEYAFMNLFDVVRLGWVIRDVEGVLSAYECETREDGRVNGVIKN